MSVFHWLAKFAAPLYRSSCVNRVQAIRRRRDRLSLTILEDRLAPAVLTVNSLADGPVSAAGSTLTLREAIDLVDTAGAATDSSGHSLAAAKAGQVSMTSPFGSNDTIQFAPSLFNSAQQIVLSVGPLLLDRNVTIDGPGASQLDVSGNYRSIVFEVAAGATAGISGLTVDAGATSGNLGGGIVNYGALTLTGVDISDNSADDGSGGGIANLGTLTLTDSTVSGNTAHQNAGILNTGTLTLTESTVSGNTAIQGNGGIGSYGGALILVDSTISGNSALTAGGMGNYDNGKATLVGSTVSGNVAVDAGGIFNTAALTLTDSTVLGNAAIGNGGIFNSGNLTLSESIVSGNMVVGGNGGIGSYGGSMTLVNSTVSGNSASAAGGIGIYDSGTATLVNSTVSDNSAGDAGGIYNTATLTLTNSTVSGNAAPENAGILNTGALTQVGSTVSGDSAGGADNVSVTLLSSMASGVSVGISGIFSMAAPSPTGSPVSRNGTALPLSDSAVAGNSASSADGIDNFNIAIATLLAGAVSCNPASVAADSANTGAAVSTNSAVAGNSGNAGRADDGDGLPPVDNALSHRSTNDAAILTDSTGKGDRGTETVLTLADRTANSGAPALADFSYSADDAREETSALIQEMAPLRSPEHASDANAPAMSSWPKIEDGRGERLIWPDNQNSLDQQRAFQTESTTGDLGGLLLLLLPWLLDRDCPIEERPADPPFGEAAE